MSSSFSQSQQRSFSQSYPLTQLTHKTLEYSEVNFLNAFPCDGRGTLVNLWCFLEPCTSPVLLTPLSLLSVCLQSLFPQDIKLHFNLFSALLLVIQLLLLVMHSDHLYPFISLFLRSVLSFLSYEGASFDV